MDWSGPNRLVFPQSDNLRLKRIATTFKTELVDVLSPQEPPLYDPVFCYEYSTDTFLVRRACGARLLRCTRGDVKEGGWL